MSDFHWEEKENEVNNMNETSSRYGHSAINQARARATTNKQPNATSSIRGSYAECMDAPFCSVVFQPLEILMCRDDIVFCTGIVSLFGRRFGFCVF